MHHFKAMNTEMYTYGLSERNQLEAERWFRSVEGQLSRFLQDSELTLLNRAAGTPFTASPLLYEVAAEAVKYHIITGGLFNPFLGKVLADAGYRDSFEAIGTDKLSSGSQNTASQPIRSSAAPSVPLLDPARRCITLPSGSELDLGGIAKGWSAEKFALRMQTEGVLLGAVDAGGDIMLWGKAPRLIDVADPFVPEKDVATLRIEHSAGVATSSRLKRKWTAADGSVRHHILDPRTLLPSSSDLVQVTVICPTLTEAEVYAKCVLILGSNKGVPRLEQNAPACAMIGVREDRSIITAGPAEAFIQNPKGGALHAGMG